MTGHLPLSIEGTLEDVLEPGEEILGAVSTLAGTLLLTDRRVVIVREGRSYRSRSGVRSWGIVPGIDLHYRYPRGGMGRLVVGSGTKAVSFFVNEADWADAMGLVTMAHKIAYRGTTMDARI